MVEITVEYEGQLRCTAVHGPSGKQLQTDAPVDNMGKGETFSPTDLMATALGSCILTVMGIIAQRHKFEITGTAVRVQKEMSADSPRRIARLPVQITVPVTLPQEMKDRLVHAANGCPVKNSLRGDIEIPITWNWAT